MPVLKQLSDPYDRRARLYPVFVVLLPLGLAVGCWIPFELEVLGSLGGLAASLGLSAFLTQLARDSGKSKEPGLFRRWGGKPSILALSYRSGIDSPATLARCHAKLEQLDPKLSLPKSVEEEIEDPVATEAAYESANDLLLARTRDREKFPLLFEENINYGYRRNLWGMRSAGAITSLIGLASGAARFTLALQQTGRWNIEAGLGVLVCSSLLVLWVLRITPNWVKVAADAYSRQLIQACESL